MPSINSMFNFHDPPVDRCSLCFGRQGPFHFESRPTGLNFSLQAWPHCSRCWNLIHERDAGAIQPAAEGAMP
jgi:hypothetical protein